MDRNVRGSGIMSICDPQTVSKGNLKLPPLGLLFKSQMDRKAAQDVNIVTKHQSSSKRIRKEDFCLQTRLRGGNQWDMSSGSSSWRLYRLVGDHLGKRWFHRSQGSSSSSGQGKSSRFKFQDDKSRCDKAVYVFFSFAFSLIRLAFIQPA